MTYLLTGLVLFFAAHFYSAFRSRTPEKDIRQKIGYGRYMGLYSLVSAVGLGLIIFGYADARPAEILYTPPGWGRTAALFLMLPALILLTSAYLPAGHIKKRHRHPMIIGVAVWAVAHLLANGDIASVLLCGSFLAFAVIDRLALAMRGDEGAFSDAPAKISYDLGAVAIGTGAYALIALWLHRLLIGVPVV